jgi:ABC-type sugar transport system ATPase subunit
MDDQTVSLGIRPEHIRVITDGSAHCRGEVEVVERLGSDTIVYTNVDGWGIVVTRLNGTVGIKIGDAVGLAFDMEQIRLFDIAGKAIRSAA